MKREHPEVETVFETRFELGEGPIWWKDRLHWVDIQGKKVCSWKPGDPAHHEIDVKERVGTVVPRSSGGLVVALDSGFAFLDPDTGRLDPICDPESDRPDNRFNDGKCDPAGRFWAGTMGLVKKPKQGALYVLETDHTCRKAFADVGTSNGIVWSADAKTMFYIDTPTSCIDAFDYDLATGALSNRREWVRVPREAGFPDGMTIDAKGNLWVGLWEGGAVAHISTQWREIRALYEIPASRVTACAFGGPGLEDLYVTTAIKDGEPESGKLFRFRPGVSGTPAHPYQG